ncbi:protein Lines homolog 1 isoform X1 [Pipistrellus kuhlii]|uniref:Lines-like protein 1 n=1 Tax=Pipistrellus kuhlii TaxID=59472 RepID=A0A7J7SFN7_PIPKU|nr:protein Lines homolog 1 isoform X1 [Pipistrellus kuhlii]XP_045427976.1 protein Lines homolog 1 isoform X1 [Pipistrellus kuhlii]KAF6287134.1 lines-like protein 1 [Pipistrellus kuhlii]
MKDSFEVLDRLYKKVLVGATLENDTQDYVCYLHPAFPDHDGSGAASSEPAVPLSVQGKGQPSLSPVHPATGPWKSSARDLALLRLTVIQVMVSRALSAETEFRAKEKYRAVLKALLKSSDPDSQLVCTFQDSDKLLSHMTAKCLAWLLYFQLREQITLSNSWIAFCQKSLSEYSESDKVVYCLWTLTAVIKEIFKDTCSQKPDLLKRLLAPLDPPLEAFYDSFFSQHPESTPGARDTASSLLGLLELLELLVASRAHGDLHLTCQGIVFSRPSRVLSAIAWPAQALVRRKLVLFLKRCLLWNAGEDLCRGASAAPAPPHRHADGDTAALADAVLHAVDAGLLGTLSVHGKPACFAGGEVQPGCERPPGPDHVILRATSLLIMKSLEIKFQKCASAEEMKVALQKYMTELLAFLQPHLQPPVQAHNPCEWLSRVFIEQDDDMLEAARASMGIYLKLTREREAAQNEARERETWSRHTHDHGCNPHCIFLFLLKNVGFDSTVLLDFLISSETCFLEYFVRYLKLLPRDWDAFLTVCKHFDVADCTDSTNTCGRTSSLGQDTGGSRTESRPRAALGRHRGARACVSRASEAPPDPSHRVAVSRESHATPHTGSRSPLQAAQSLVDYDTSDDSEAESPDVCSANTKQTPAHREATEKTRDAAGTRRGERERSSELPSGPVVPKEAHPPLSVGRDQAPRDAAYEVGTFYQTAKCFRALQGAVARLQRKNLFPYNPTALLRLLKQVEAICTKTTDPF